MSRAGGPEAEKLQKHCDGAPRLFLCSSLGSPVLCVHTALVVAVLMAVGGLSLRPGHRDSSLLPEALSKPLLRMPLRQRGLGLRIPGPINSSGTTTMNEME